jgi:alpha-galactosidase
MTTPLRGSGPRRIRKYTLPLLLAAGSMLLSSTPSQAQVNGVGQLPYLGWGTFSEQTINGSFLTQANVQAQSDALAASGLQKHGWQYINIDSGWMSTFDANGRPIPAAPNFPDIKALIDHIHANGQKVSIYWIPGIEQPAVDGNYPILGTQYTTQQIVVEPLAQGNAFAGALPNPYHDKIDFTKPGAQEYINSIVALFASWGVDAIKFDGVTPGSYVDNLNIDNRPDVEAWSKAIAASGRPIFLTISWAIDQDYLSTWQEYSNARRIEDDVECEGNCATLTDWPRIYQRFRDVPGWENDASPQAGWNDLDSLDVTNGLSIDGLTNEDTRTAVSLWSLANAPMVLGGDLTKLTSFAKEILSNDEVVAVNQSGHPAKQVLGGYLPVWVSKLNNNTYYVGVFNLNATPAVAQIPWNLIGVTGAIQMRDLWKHENLGPSLSTYSTLLPGHGVRLFKVTTFGHVAPTASTSYEAEDATLSGSAAVASCPNCSGGEKVGGLGLGVNNAVTFTNVYARKAGVYYMQVNSMTQGLRSYIYTVNDGLPQTLDSGGGSFFIPASTSVPVRLQKGMNSIRFGSPVSYPPDLDRIVISGDGNAFYPPSTTYEAELATLSGTVTASFNNYSSGLANTGNIGGGPGNNVTFSNVTVPRDGVYLLEVDGNTSGPRSFFLTINDGTPQELDFNGTTFSEPVSYVYRVQLHAGTNTLSFGNTNSGGYCPNLDRIVVAPALADDPWENQFPKLW